MYNKRLQPTIASATPCASAQAAPNTLAAEANVIQPGGWDMRRHIVSWVAVFGSFLLAGCTPYQEVRVRTDAAITEIGVVQIEADVGDAVRVTTYDGVRHSGTIASWSIDLLVLYLSGDDAIESREFASGEIAKLEKKTGASGIGGLIIIGAIATIFWVASSSAGIGIGLN